MDNEKASATILPRNNPSFSRRSINVELDGQEVITIDLDSVDSNPEDISNLLKKRSAPFSSPVHLCGWRNLRARALHAERFLKEATKYYTTATDGQPKNVLGAIVMAQMQIQNDEIGAAIHTFDLLLQPPNPQHFVEAMVMLTPLHAHPRLGHGVSSSDLAQDKAKALEQDDSRASNGHVLHCNQLYQR
ncbi:hypothetical protein EDB19DRAFT_1917926 [Suillus lakei]|nr:hypothetical protein EDB19DRAFT_1917926 [Suillus lakei]